MTADTTPRIFDITITATMPQRLNAVHHCLCNSGLTFFGGYGLSVDWPDGDYQVAAEKLQTAFDFGANNVCHEDVLIQIIKDGNRIVIRDDEDNGAIVGNLSLVTIHGNWDAIRQSDLLELYHEQDDADTADCILQTLCFGSIVYG